MNFATTPSVSARTTAAYGGLCLSVLGWASAFIAGKVALAEIAPLPTAAWRLAIASAVLLPFAWRARPRERIGCATKPLLVMILLGGIVCPSLFHIALAETSATNAALLMALSPALTALAAPLIGEVRTSRGLIGVFVALTGAAIVISDGDPWGRSSAITRGDLLVLVVAAGMVGLHLSSQRVVSRLAPSFTSFVVLTIGSVALFALSSNDGPIRQVAHATPGARGALAIMGILSSAIAGQLFLNAVRTIGISRAVVFVYLVPVATAGLSVVWLGDSLSTPQVVGGGAVLAGVYAASR